MRPVLEDIPALTEAKGFVEGVENGKFDFEVIKGHEMGVIRDISME